MRPLPVLFALAVFASPAVRPAPAAAQDAPRKVAFVVGVGEYKFAYPNLGKSPVQDVTKLGEELRRGGFEAFVLTDKTATKAAIEKQFLALLSGPKAIRKGDVLLVALCGHGEQMATTNPATKETEDEPYFCPHDAKSDDVNTLVGLNWMIRKAEPNGATTLFLVDACRTITDQNRTRSGIQGKQVKLPPRTAILFSCARGEVSHQPEAIGHGLFTYAVLKAVRGDAVQRGEMSWTELVHNVEKAFNSNEFKKMMPAGRKQTPVEAKGEMSYTELFTVASPPPAAKTPTPVPAVGMNAAPRSLYGSDAQVRPIGHPLFGPLTPRFGIEAFLHAGVGAHVGITETGMLAVFPSARFVEPKLFTWSHRLELLARKGDEVAVTASTKTFAVEVYHDRAADRLVYVCETGAIAVAPVPPVLGKDKAATALRGHVLNVRKPEQIEFKGAKRLGVEVYRDENTGGVIYITETGSIATSQAAQGTTTNEVRSLYGLTPKVRTADEFDFSPTTKQVGLEVYEDPKGAALLYVTDAGHIAVLPGGKAGEKQGRSWLAAMVLRVRKAGAIDFDQARKFGVEVNVDDATGARIFVCETGSIAVIPK